MTERIATHGTYTNTFTCVPASVPYRPARITPKPVVSGIQTAVVVGPKGEEIHTDKYGRVKVHFHWDREGRKKKDDTISIWIRTAHNIAGNKWGFMAIPRIGQEVVVEFIEGDPDRPIITGCVYNADQMPHYDLPAEKTKTYIKTNSSKGGKGHNEIMFEDKADDERLYLHAQKNMDVRVLNDSKERIYGNRHQIIGWEKDGKKGGDQREMVWQDKHLKIKRNQIEHIEGNMELLIGKGEADDGGNLDIYIEKQKTETIGGGFDLNVQGDLKEKVGGAHGLTVGGNLHQKVGGDFAVESGPANEIHLKAGMKVIIEAGMQVSLKGPGGFINIGPSGVDIQGILVNINSGGSAGSGSGCSPASPKDAKEAAPTEPDQAHNSKSGMKSAPD
jgi:type VI secretion system secreted protein VgrG